MSDLTDLSSVPESPDPPAVAGEGDPDHIAAIRAQIGSAGPLAAYGGEKPAAPAWFEEALAQTPEEGFVEVDGARLHWMAWGARGLPGALLLHGNGAHAGWWRALAPALAAPGRRIVAFSFSGMGLSDWRERYSIKGYVDEILAVLDATGLSDAPSRPALVGHSFGGFPALSAAVDHASRISGLVMLDSAIRPPEDQWRGPPTRTSPNRVFATLEEGLARFRLAPPQECENHWILDQIARESLKPVEGGWSWRFDPFMWANFAFDRADAHLGRLSVPTAVVRGRESMLMGPAVWDHMRAVFPPGTLFSSVPEARHHLLLDQPIATLSVVDVLLSRFV